MLTTGLDITQSTAKWIQPSQKSEGETMSITGLDITQSTAKWTQPSQNGQSRISPFTFRLVTTNPNIYC